MSTVLFDGLYAPYDHERRAFGTAWCGPEKYSHGEEALCARYEASFDSDGQTVEVHCEAWPARFYRLRALAGNDSVGEPLPSFTLCTGSGMAALAAEIAKAISTGMLSFGELQPTRQAIPNCARCRKPMELYAEFRSGKLHSWAECECGAKEER